MKKQQTKPLLEDVEDEVNAALAGKKKPEPEVTVVDAGEKIYYRLEKKGTYDWFLYEMRGGVETLLKKDIQEICWAYMKRAIIGGTRSRR